MALLFLSFSKIANLILLYRLFSCPPKGAKASSIVYSIIETTKENVLKPFEYLK